MTTQYVGNRRLLKLATFLETLPKHKFNLSVIVDDGKVFGWNSGKDEPDDSKLPGSNPHCGTAACAIGWCPNVFPRNCSYKIYGYVDVISKNTGKSNFSFAKEFFGLTQTELWYLFMPGYYPKSRRGNKSVANRIRKFVENRPSEKIMEKAELTDDED